MLEKVKEMRLMDRRILNKKGLKKYYQYNESIFSSKL